jgi:hypothetical protein
MSISSKVRFKRFRSSRFLSLRRSQRSRRVRVGSRRRFELPEMMEKKKKKRKKKSF